MKFLLRTLVDITQTDARRGDDPFEHKQQQNFMTTVQTISLRSNPIINKKPTCEKMTSKQADIAFKGKQNVWTLEFEFESEGQHSVEFLTEDFNYVPVINQLTESIDLDPSAFITFNGNTNTIFKKIDK